MLLAFAIEAITGKGLDAFLKETFWDPMGLTHTTYPPLLNGFAANDCAATELNGNPREGALSFTGVRPATMQACSPTLPSWQNWPLSCSPAATARTATSPAT